MLFSLFFFFNDTATTEIYTLSLHDALPISPGRAPPPCGRGWASSRGAARPCARPCRRMRTAVARSLQDRKSTRLNSSHGYISYAVFCLKKKNESDWFGLGMWRDGGDMNVMT